MVEMVIVLLIFLVLIFGIIEFGLAIVKSAQLTKAVSYGARYVVVNDPPASVTLPSCIDGNNSVEIVCDASSCSELMAEMEKFAPILNYQEGIVVRLKYSCQENNYIDRDELYLVTLSIEGARHKLFVPGLLGIELTVDLQDFVTTRLSEDLHTPVLN